MSVLGGIKNRSDEYMKDKLLWLAHLMSNAERRIKITLTDGTEIIGKTVIIDDVDDDELIDKEEPYSELYFVEDFTKRTYFLKEEDIIDIDPVGWEM